MGLEPIIHEVIGGNPAWLEALIELFTTSFPQYAHTAPRLRQKATLPANANPKFIAHQWLVELDGKAVGLHIFKYAPARNVGLGIYLAVKPAYRKILVEPGYRLSEWLCKAGIEKLQEEAQTAGQPAPPGLFGEVESDKIVARYHEFGFMELPLEYYEPRFRQARATGGPTDWEHVDWVRMHLCGLPIGGFDPTDPALLTNVVLAFMVDHYGLPQNHWAVQRVLESIRRV